MSDRRVITVGNSSLELVTQGSRFLGLGAVRIGDTLVRSGRLPLSPFTQSYAGHELDHLELVDVIETESEIRIGARAVFRPLPVKLMRDHSFDPIHDSTDWDADAPSGEGRLDLVLRPATDEFNGVEFEGFSYHYEYESEAVPLFWILDRASWELDGDITGAAVYSQSSCSAPVCTFGAETAWSTEGIIHWQDDSAKANPVMTHNLPRWASHQAFDFQFKGNATLLGVYERVDLIRSMLAREPGKAELKTFDKHIFDQTGSYATSPKRILLNNQAKTLTGQQNLWTWVFDEVADRARAEFGLKEESLMMRLGQNYWVNWTLDSYYKDLIPAAKAIGIKYLFTDNVNRSDYTEYNGYPENWSNMCGGHEYEPSPKVGGPEGLKRFVSDCAEMGVTPYSWTNNDQSVLCPNYIQHGDWFVRMEDARLKYGGAYTNGFGIWSAANPEARQYWVNCLKKTRQETGLKGYLFDSFYNLGFMPVNYDDCQPRTHWREMLLAFKELQDADVHFMIESFGPFGEVQHGCPSSYSPDNLFACYKIGLGSGYTTIPTGQEKARHEPWPADVYFRILAHMSRPDHPLFYDGVRIDKLFTEEHKQALAAYHACQPHMARRYLQEDGQSVIWHDSKNERATIWSFADQDARLPGTVTDLATGQALPRAETYRLAAGQVYVVTRAEALPVAPR